MSLRKSFDSFAPQHKLRDAEEAYEQNVSDVKREMDFLFRKVEHYRHCLYAAKPLEEYLEYSAASPSAEARCPKPAWV